MTKVKYYICKCGGEVRPVRIGEDESGGRCSSCGRIWMDYENQLEYEEEDKE